MSFELAIITVFFIFTIFNFIIFDKEIKRLNNLQNAIILYLINEKQTDGTFAEAMKERFKEDE